MVISVSMSLVMRQFYELLSKIKRSDRQAYMKTAVSDPLACFVLPHERLSSLQLRIDYRLFRWRAK